MCLCYAILLLLQSTLAKLSPDRTVHMILLCVLGPLAIIPFAIVRVGTSHLYLWAMGMVSALYVGMPIIAGFPLHDLGRLWMRAVVFILVAALVAMFAGSVLSMLVLPSLASHAVSIRRRMNTGLLSPYSRATCQSGGG